MSAWMRPFVMVRNAIMIPRSKFRKSTLNPHRKEGFLSQLFSTLTEYEAHHLDEHINNKVLSGIKSPAKSKLADETDENRTIVAPFKSSSGSSSGNTLPSSPTPVPRLLTKSVDGPAPITTTSTVQQEPQLQPQPHHQHQLQQQRQPQPTTPHIHRFLPINVIVLVIATTTTTTASTTTAQEIITATIVGQPALRNVRR